MPVQEARLTIPIDTNVPPNFVVNLNPGGIGNQLKESGIGNQLKESGIGNPLKEAGGVKIKFQRFPIQIFPTHF